LLSRKLLQGQPERGAKPTIEGLLRATHLLLILFVALFVFGPKKLPELGKGLAQGIRSFKDAIKLTEHSAATEIEEKK
jgi:sec-independent protein translocase protein TatA